MDMEMTYICGSCGKGFKRSDNLKKHLLTHTGVRPFQCNMCGKSFRERNHLSSHVLLHTGEKPYKCNHCGKAFNQNSNLKKHIKIHTNDRPHACSICDNRFTQQCYLNEHMKNHTGERAHECTDCGKKFKNSSHLRSHRKTHSDERPYKCSFCDKTFKYSRNYSLHIMSHDGDSSCSCGECGKEFMNRNNLKIHMLSHSSIKLHECFVCGKEFQKLDKFKRHLQAHTGERPFKCSICEEGFKSSTHLKYHMMIHTGEKPFTCEVCGSGFRSKSYLTSHMVSHDSNRHECSICRKSFKYKCNYTRHMKTHFENETPESLIRISTVTQQNSLNAEKVIIQTLKSTSSSGEEVTPVTHVVNSDDLEETIPIVTEGEIVEEDQKITVVSCSTQGNRNLDSSSYRTTGIGQTGSEFGGQASVKILMRSCTDSYPFHCVHCKETFRQESQLKEHLEFHKSGSYQCHLCNAFFRERDYLQAHFKSHRHLQTHFKSHRLVQNEDMDTWNVGDEGCKVCGKKFLKKYLLRRHMLVHMDDRAFECTICKKRFKDKTVLKTHSMIHTGKRRYACNICDKKFMQSSDKKRHMKTHNVRMVAKDKPFSCSVCGLKFCYKFNLETHEMFHVMRDDAFQNEKQELASDGCTSGNAVNDRNIIHTLMGQYTFGKIVPYFEPEETVTHIISEVEMDSKTTIGQMNSLAQEHKAYELAEERILDKSEYYVDDQSSKQKFVCVICGEDCMEQAFLKVHIKQHKLECPQCGKAFSRLNNLKRHMVIHAGVRPYECAACDKKYKESGHLKAHMQVHIDGNDFECEFCSKKFSYKSNYIRHLKTHSGENPYICNICGLVFALEETYETHQMLHVTQKPVGTDELPQGAFRDDCGEKFNTVGEVNSFRVGVVSDDAEEAENGSAPTTVDLDETVYKCSLCIKGFSKKSNLKRHQMTHTGERPYDCSSCGKRFKEKKCRNEHEMVHSHIRPHVCMICNKRFTQKSVLNRHRKTHGVIEVSSKNDSAQAVYENLAVKNSDTSDMEEKVKSVRIPHGDAEVAKEILCEMTEPTVEIQVGKIAIQTISYEAAIKRRQMLKERRLHRCTVCNKLFNRKSNLARHVQSHIDSQRIKCHLCKSSFKSKHHFETHMLMHGEESTQHCNTHGETLNGDDLQEHIRSFELKDNKHSSLSDSTVPSGNDHPLDSPACSQTIRKKGESLLCSICGMKFHFKHHLENHRIIHELRKKIGYEEGAHHKIVIKSRASKTEMDFERSHQGVVENKGESKVIIVKEEPVCDDERNLGEMELGKITVKTLPYTVALERRLKARGNKKRVNCEVCGKDFSSKYNLKVHMTLHNGKKTYVSSACGEKFHFNCKNHTIDYHDRQRQVEQLPG